MKSSQRRSAFTLVELLVVIGVIALLISILLPSLNKARQFANSIKCASNQRSIGQLFALYASQNKGYLPRSSGTYDPNPNTRWQDPKPTDLPTFPNPQNDQCGDLGPSAFWYDFLSLTADPKRTLWSVAGNTGAGTGAYASLGGGLNNYTNLANCGYMAADVLPIFHDTDLSVDTFKPRVSTYYVNMRVVAAMNAKDRAVSGSGNANGQNYYMPQRSQGGIKNASRVMMMWCGPIRVGPDGAAVINQYDNGSWGLDGFCYNNGQGHYYLDTLQNGYGIQDKTVYDRRIGISSDVVTFSGGTTVTLSFLKSQNVDYNGTIGNAMRFRHLNNTTVNALFVDGHVESRQLGDVYVRDVVLNKTKY